jgi:hypothetical protein
VRSWLRGDLIGLAVCMVLGHAAQSLAQERGHGVALNWVRLPGAEACIPAAELAQRVEQRLERSIFVVDAAATVSVDGSVQRSEQGFVVRLALSDRTGRVLGERMLDSAGEDCRALDEAVVLIVAVTLVPQRLLAAGSGIKFEPATERLLQELFHNEPTELDVQELEPAWGDESYAAAADVTPSALPGRAPAPRRWSERQHRLLAVTGGAVLTAGYLPGLAPGLELVFTLSPAGLWPLRLSAVHLVDRTVAASMLDAGVTHFGLSQASLAACPWQTGSQLQVQLCTGLGLALLRTASTGYAQGGVDRSDLMFDAQSQLDLNWRILTHVVLRLGAGVALPFIQRRYAYQGLDGQAQPLFRTTQLTGRLGLGLGVTF